MTKEKIGKVNTSWDGTKENKINTPIYIHEFDQRSLLLWPEWWKGQDMVILIRLFPLIFLISLLSYF